MKDKKKDINLKRIISQYEILVDEIEMTMQEHDITPDDMAHEMAEQLEYSTFKNDGFYALEYAYDIKKPLKDIQTLSVRGAMHWVRDRHLLEYLNCVSDVIGFIRSNEGGGSRYEWEQALISALDLESYANGELYERVQIYKNKIKELED